MKNWKLAFHLFLGTKRFGVNNGWTSDFDSLFRIPVFGFGYQSLLRPWKWRAIIKVVKLRMEIAGWKKK